MPNYFPNGFVNHEAITWGPETQAKAYAQQADGRHLWVHNAYSTAAQESVVWDTAGNINIRSFGSILNVKNFGAAGDGSTDDSAAFASAITAFPTAGGILLVPAGTYRFTASPLQIIDNTANNNRKGITIMGVSGGASGGSLATVLEWNGAGTDAFIQLYSRDNVLRDLAIRCVAGKTTDALIDIDAATGAGAGACTNNSTQNVFITEASGTATDGIRIGNTGLANCDYNNFVNTYVNGVTGNGVNLVGANGQSKHNFFLRCAFVDADIHIKQTRGSFRTQHCAWGTCVTTAIMLTNANDEITIADSDLESCPRFLNFSGGSSAFWPVSIRGGRFDLTSLHADGEFIRFGFGGPLTIQGCEFSNGAAHVSTFKLYTHAADPGTILVSQGNSFPTTTPYYQDASHRMRLISFGNMGVASGNVMSHVNDEDTQYVSSSATATLGLGTVSGISGTLTLAQNLRGNVTLQGATSSGQAAIAFSTSLQEANNSYFVALGGNINQSFWVTSKSTSGFTINASATTSTATIDWILVR